jgi:hypothetical protein
MMVPSSVKNEPAWPSASKIANSFNLPSPARIDSIVTDNLLIRLFLRLKLTIYWLLNLPEYPSRNFFMALNKYNTILIEKDS